MSVSIFLAQVLSIYFIVIGITLIKGSLPYKKMLDELDNSPVLNAISGLIALIIGALIVCSHTIWTLDYRGVITLIGWISLAKAVWRLLYPTQPIFLKNLLCKKTTMVTLGALNFTLGVWLAYCGW